MDRAISCRKFFRRTRNLGLGLSLACILSATPAFAAEQPQWLRISSDHFIVYTDAGEKRGHEVAARFEQMRAMYGTLMGQHRLRMSEPMEIIAFKSDKDFALVAPMKGGQPLSAPAFWLTGDDRIFVVLDLFEPDSWRAVEHQFAHYFLTYNYPPTQPWFDEGFAEYFSSVSFTSSKAEVGADPTLNPLPQTDILDDQTQVSGLKTHAEILMAPIWLTLPDLFGMRNRVVNGQEGTHQTLFYAESWMLVHYLINTHKLEQTGNYFDLVENLKMPAEPAVQQAYGMSVAELDKAVKDYFHSLKPVIDAMWAAKMGTPAQTANVVYELPLPLEVDDVGSSKKELAPAEAQALIAEMELRIPERRAQALQQLQQLAGDEKTDSAVVHRALAWAHVLKGETTEAFDELNTARDMDPNDPWVRLGLAEATYHSGEKGAKLQGLANTMQSLQKVIDEYPDFAEAYALLGWARLTGGGSNSAIEAMKSAIGLSPRNESYQLRLAETYLAMKKWDEATGVLERLKTSTDLKIASAAKKELNDLPFLKKFGVPPQAGGGPQEVITANTQKRNEVEDDKDKDKDEDEDPKPAEPAAAEPGVDKRPVHFIRATLVAVDCAQAPVAVLTVAAENRTLKLRTEDYKNLAVIATVGFSCDWKNMAVSINYKRGGKADGDLVSIEIR